jgi:flagellar biogenesis protein FliO
MHLKNRLFLALFFALIFLTVGAYYFIRSANDHVECGEMVREVKNSEGIIVVEKLHVCKEKYSI